MIGKNRNGLSMKRHMMRNNVMNNANIVGNSMIRSDTTKTLEEGVSGSDVEKLQTMLLDIAHIYPDIIILTPDGKFDGNTKMAVEQFQRSVGMKETGVVDIITWNQIKKIHKDKCNGNNSDIQLEQNRQKEYLELSRNVIHEGSTGRYVVTLQEYLNVIARRYPSIMSLKVDGIFGPRTKSSVFEFQKLFGLPIDGIVGTETWEKLDEEYTKIMGELY